MTRNDLERHLGQYIEVTLFDRTTYEGILHRTGETIFKDEPNLSIPKNFYFCTDRNNNFTQSVVFRVSHIKKIKHVKKQEDYNENYRKAI